MQSDNIEVSGTIYTTFILFSLTCSSNRRVAPAIFPAPQTKPDSLPFLIFLSSLLLGIHFRILLKIH